VENNVTINYRNPMIVRRLGIEALTKELGEIGMVYFMRQFEAGYGDYTTERDKLLADITEDELIAEIRALEEKRANLHG
jgi:hypothetical protein